ncbi:MAG: hypothetical protein ACUVWN_07805 [bacterium]
MDYFNHKRRSIRLQGLDYSMPGAYFIIICTNNRQCLFGKTADGEMQLNKYVKIAQQCWLEIPNHFTHAKLDEFIMMPNHVHGIVILDNNVWAKNFSPIQIPRNISSEHTHKELYQQNNHWMII